MPIKNWSTTPGSNTSAPPNGAPESSTKIKDYNDIARQIMADTRYLCAAATVASAATTDLGASDETWLTVSGTTTITAFGTVSAGIYKFVTFSGTLTLTHNATSLILLGGANRTTVAGDCGLYLSLGSGNWKEYFYSPIGGYQPLDATLTALAGALTAANKIPYATALNTLGELTLDTDGTLAANSDVTLATQKAVKAYVDTKSLGIGQTWQDLAASRTQSVNYTNSTGKPIMVSASSGINASTGSTTTAYVDSVQVATGVSGSVNGTVNVSFIVPAGSVYYVYMSYDAGKAWAELR